MQEDLLISGISSVGFPIAAFYLMYTMCNKTIAENTIVLRDLKEAINGGGN